MRDLAVDAVTASRVLDGSLVGADIADGTIGASKLAPNAVLGTHIAAGAVGSNELADSSVGETKLALNAVTGAHIADGAVIGSDIEDGSLNSVDLNPDSGIYSYGAYIYSWTNHDSVDPGETISVTTSCGSAFNLPIQGICRSSNPDVYAYSQNAHDWWFNDSDPAAWECNYKNNGSSAATVVIQVRWTG